MKTYALLVLLLLAAVTWSQDASAYETSEEKKNTGLFDPSRLTIRNSLSFGAMSNSLSNASGLQSQSLYTTMMRYQFTAPVTLNLNFGLPIHSSFAQAQNLSTDNLRSMDYFKSMPFQMSLDWQPTENTSVRFSIIKAPANGYFMNSAYADWDPFYRYHDQYENKE